MIQFNAGFSVDEQNKGVVFSAIKNGSEIDVFVTDQALKSISLTKTQSLVTMGDNFQANRYTFERIAEDLLIAQRFDEGKLVINQEDTTWD